MEKAKLPTPEEQATMDASIRTNQRSVGARQMIAAVREARGRGLTRPQIEAELATWKQQYPRLFEMVLDPGHSEVMLNAMLRQLELVEAGSRSTHDASIAVGTILVNKFVRPRLGMDQAPLPDSQPQSGPQ